MHPAWSRLAPILLLSLLLAVSVLTGCQRTPAAPSRAVKLLVDADGVYEVRESDLAAAGFALKGLQAENIALSAGGEQVAFQLTRQGRESILRFYGQALGADAHTATNVYWLTRTDPPAESTPSAQLTGAGQPQTVIIESRSGALDVASEVAQVVISTVHLEEQRQHRPLALPGEPRWVWETFYAPGVTPVKFQVADPAPGNSLLSIYLIGSSSGDVDPDHHLLVTLNGQQISDSAWDGLGPHVVTATVPSGTLATGENTLAFSLPGDTGAAADAVLLDRVEIQYPRALVLNGGELVFEGDAAAYGFRVKERPALIWDITDPLRPVSLADYSVDAGIVRLPGDPASEEAQRYIAVTADGVRKPVVAPVPDAPDLRNWPGGADLLIVTVPEFRQALEPLVNRREEQGLRVAVVDVGQIYDAFTDGRAGPEAIRLFVRQALAEWTPPTPRFLLLAGDASYDPRGYLDGPEVDLVPSGSVHTSYSGWAASDVWFAVPDDEVGAPRLAVGRLPAQTPDQLAAMVSKTLDYEQATAGDWRARGLLVSDNDETGFAAEASAFGAALQGYQAEQVRIEGDGASARERLLSAFEAGTGLIGYFGHGSVTLWAQEKVFGVDDAGKLANRDRLPVVFTVTCLSGYFDHPSTPSLGETLVRGEKGGAVAALVPSSAAILSDQSPLAHGLSAALSAARTTGEPSTLGEVVLRSQGELPDAPGAREILLTFNLLGDPSLRLPR